MERIDDRADYGEERFIIVGMAEPKILLFVAYAERDEKIRLISRITSYNVCYTKLLRAFY